MPHKRFHIVVALTLAGLFTLFNVGLPIVTYVCPMMANERCACACTVPTANGPSLTYVHSSCCNNEVLAERNTVPFVGEPKFNPPHSEFIFALTPESQVDLHHAQSTTSLSMTDAGPPPNDTPLYLLSSTLLI